ncbi:Transmembrane emp24 domain-containing protein 1 [Armadillidium nasatum]|uniref:Transmembrane emp24 domain-containing protein 1 n=1 Tax=Armadillidium nasatum TaxID=96803 RepID=A0A5N5T849_9CRUS|nr:Transmembrane emp24 domain-containing protein 1 [Armadillidium nasatum]
MKSFLAFFVLSLSYKLILGRDIEREMTIEVQPGREECFYQDIIAGETLDLEYQVIDGGQGNLDINYYVAGPQGNILVQDNKKSDAAHRTTMSESGDYKICWDNSYSRFNSKTVFFGLIIESDDDNDQEALWGEGIQGSPYKEEDIYEMKVEDIKDSVDRIRAHLTKSRFLQDQLRAFEARDRNIAENNYSRVNRMSLLNLAVMLVTGLIQVLLLRSLFDEKSRLHKLWKKGSSSSYS